MASVPTIVYVVDDDFGVLGSLRFLLETDGFEVRTFRNGAALLDAVVENHVDCIVIDYKMPTMNGIELAKKLRARRVEAPIVLITGYPDESISTRAAASGVYHVVLKPHLEDSLVSHIRGAMQEGGQGSAGTDRGLR
ncbi:MAG TPA: response regulator [Rhodopseudomonas sp.]|uniref:response regulator transcription factor n=1 Tax=Rhodopseudomonas sp. TaxID=1078 RepID=UPI002ED80A78